jgi:hypothetical protein
MPGVGYLKVASSAEMKWNNNIVILHHFQQWVLPHTNVITTNTNTTTPLAPAPSPPPQTVPPQ